MLILEKLRAFEIDRRKGHDFARGVRGQVFGFRRIDNIIRRDVVMGVQPHELVDARRLPESGSPAP